MTNLGEEMPKALTGEIFAVLEPMLDRLELLLAQGACSIDADLTIEYHALYRRWLLLSSGARAGAY